MRLDGDDIINPFAEHLFARPSVQFLGAGIPELNHPVGVAHHDGFGCEVKEVGALLQFAGAFADAVLELLIEQFQLAALAMKFSKDADFRAQQFRNHRYSDVVDRSLAIAFNSIDVAEVNSRNEDDCRLLKTRMLANHLGKIETIDVGHADIRQDDGDVFLQQMFERFAPKWP